MLITLIGHFSLFKRMIFKSLPDEVANPYFHALLSDKENQYRISRKILALPGIKKVSVLSSEKLQEEVSNLLDEIDSQLVSNLFDFNFVGLKVVFKKTLQERSQKLIREYLIRLAGEDNITLGAIRTDDLYAKKHGYLVAVLKKWGGLFLVFVFSILWMIALYGFSGELRKHSYLIEQFQRRNYVAFKIISTGLVLVFALSFALLFILGTPSYLNLLFIVIVYILVMLLHFKKFSWQTL